MILIEWNCRGLGNTHTVRVLRDLIRYHKPDLLFLSETLVDSNEVEALPSKFGFPIFFSVGRQGRGGGLAVFWKHNMQCTAVDSSQNHVDLNIRERQNNV